MSGSTGSNADRRRPPVMADVARLAGVSHQTVSRVINENPLVHPETRQRVIEAMRKLDYRPNSAARALATGRSRTVGVISFDTVLYGPNSTLFAIHRAAHEDNYFISTVSLRNLDVESLVAAIDRLRSQGVEGALVVAAETESANALLRAAIELPVVAVEAGPQGVPLVTVDQVAGARAATEHLLELGHRTVWHVAGPHGWFESEKRVEGWRAALTAANAVVPHPMFGDWSAAAGYRLGTTLATDPEVTAVFVANDQMALGLLRALGEAGRAVPEEVSVVGFDDVPEAEFYQPPLTTVRQDFIAVGREAFALLIREMERNTRSAERVLVPPELVVRNSTSAPTART